MDLKVAAYWRELEGDCAHADEINRNNLLGLIRDNKDTVFGREHDFVSIDSVEEYRRRLPISGYEPFRSYVDAMMNGEKDQLTVYPVYNYCHTSGSEGLAKYIPVTEETLRRSIGSFNHRQDDLIKECGGMRLNLNTFRTDLNKETSQRLIFSEAYYRYIYEHGMMNADEYLGGLDVLFCEEPGDRLFTRLWLGFACEEITLIESVFQYDALIFFTYMRDSWRKVYDAMRTRCIPEDVTLPENIRKYLLSMPYTDERLDNVKAVCEAGMNGIAKRLWPGLKLISGISNKNFNAEEMSLHEYIGDPEDVNYYYLIYAASECIMSSSPADNCYSYLLRPEAAFFEFLPMDESEVKDSEFETVLPKELKVGAEYCPIVTNFSGFYRYMIEDVVIVKGFVGQSPLLEFIKRRSHTLNINGEKVDVRSVEKEIAQLPDPYKVMEWTIGIERNVSPGRYFLAAVSADGKVGLSDEMADILDEGLARANPDYEDLRHMNYISKLRVLLLPPGAYGRFMSENGLASGHKKPNHVSKAGFSTETCRKWVEKYEK